VDEEPDHSQVLMVLVQDPDAGTPFQELPVVEAPAEDPVGGSENVDRYVGARIDSRSESSPPTSGAAKRSWTFSLPLMWGGEPLTRLEKTLGGRCLRGRLGNENERRGRRDRRWGNHSRKGLREGGGGVDVVSLIVGADQGRGMGEPQRAAH